jgi:hypothetical protein
VGLDPDGKFVAAGGASIGTSGAPAFGRRPCRLQVKLVPRSLLARKRIVTGRSPVGQVVRRSASHQLWISFDLYERIGSVRMAQGIGQSMLRRIRGHRSGNRWQVLGRRTMGEEGRDTSDRHIFQRPLGGSVEFGEPQRELETVTEAR